MRKRMGEKLKSRLSLFTVFLLLFNCLFSMTGEEFLFAAEKNAGAPNEIIEIGSPEEFADFAEKSGDADYTRGKSFALTGNINLTGMEISPIQSFAGSFDGRGHTLMGFSYFGNTSGVGLFRMVDKGAEIKDLILITNIMPSGDKRNIGGIAGENNGVIRNCTVKGRILGFEAVGGIAGRNSESGVIIGCTNECGGVFGMRRTGGIAGFNEGIIDSSINLGGINQGSKTAWEIDDERKKTKEQEEIEKGDDESSESNENLEKLVPDNMDVGYDDIIKLIENEQEVNYTGGIAGVNSGEISKCKNKGTVGYAHLGYKSGGIAGYDRGIIDSSENFGIIYGRKDTGGIAGQLEPYVKDEFSGDSLKKADEEADKLVGLITVLQNEMKNEDDNIQEHIDNIRESADTLRGSISGYKDYYRGKDDVMEADMRSHTSAIRDIINGLDINLKSGKTKDALSAVRNDLDQIEKLMSAAEKAASDGVIIDLGSYVSRVRSVSKDIDEQSVNLLKLTQNAGKEYNEVRKAASRLRDESNSFDDFLRSAYDSYKSDIRGTDDDLTNQADTIAEYMDDLSDALKGTDKVVRGRMDSITSSLSDLSEDINEGFEEARNEIDRLRNTKDINDIFDDMSDDPDSTPAKGRITKSVNHGSIITDINGGGIAGMVDTDLDLNSDFKVDSSGDYSLNRIREKRASITGCKNYGNISVKNDCAGGIAGKMDMGAVEASENFGAVKSEKGDYAGGVVGKSGFMIRDSFSMARVSGNEYVGGIAGYGVMLHDNKALATIEEGVKEKYGAIAGDVDTEEKSVSGNIFVDDALGAVNGLTFEDEARAVSFDEFIKLPGVPEESKNMTVSFMSEGEVIKTVMVPYGGSVPASDYPELDNKEDKFGVWEDTKLSDIRQNTVVNAIYESYATTVSSREHFPHMLISGKFHRDAYVSYEKEDGGEKRDALPEGYEAVISKYDFSVVSDYPPAERAVTVRLLADGYGDRDSAAIRDTEGVFSLIPTERDGRYMVFPYSLSEESGEFYIIKAKPDIRNVIFISVVAALIVLFILIQIYRGLRRRKMLKKICHSERSEES